MPLESDLAALGLYDTAAEFSAVFADDHDGLAKLGDRLGQPANDTATRDRRITHRCQALSGHIIDHFEFSEAATLRHLVVHEVQVSPLDRQR